MKRPTALQSIRQTFSDLLLSCTAPEGLQLPSSKVLSLAELTPLMEGCVTKPTCACGINAQLPAHQAML
jgi:hypothetical protein